MAKSFKDIGHLWALVFIFLFMAFSIAVFVLFFDSSQRYELLYYLGLQQAGAGKLVIFNGIYSQSFKVWHLAFLLTYFNFAYSMVVVYFYEKLFHIPLLGKKIKKLQDQCFYASKNNTFLKRFSGFSVILISSLPAGAGGPLPACIIGRFMGIKPVFVVFLSTAGTILGVLVLALTANWSNQLLGEYKNSIYFKIFGICIILALIFIFSAVTRKFIAGKA